MRNCNCRCNRNCSTKPCCNRCCNRCCNNSSNTFPCNTINTINSSNICCNSKIYANPCTNNQPSFPENYLYGHAYTPNQTMNKTFTPEIGLKNGTIFPELVSPYVPGQSMDFINYLKTGGIQNG